MLEEDVEGKLRNSSLGLRSQNRVALSHNMSRQRLQCHIPAVRMCTPRIGNMIPISTYFPAPRHAQRSKQPIPALPPLLAQHALEQRQHARPLEQLPLPGMLFKYLREGKSFNCALAWVVGGGFDGDVGGCLVGGGGLFDVEEALVGGGGGGAQAEVDVEEGGGWFGVFHLGGLVLDCLYLYARLMQGGRAVELEVGFMLIRLLFLVGVATR